MNTSAEKKYHLMLKKEFEERKKKNPAYSLRSFSRYLGLAHSTLSECLSMKHDLSKRNLKKVMIKLFVPEEDWDPYLSELKVRQRTKTL